MRVEGGISGKAPPTRHALAGVKYAKELCRDRRAMVSEENSELLHGESKEHPPVFLPQRILPQRIQHRRAVGRRLACDLNYSLK